jgi:hypothetical protein
MEDHARQCEIIPTFPNEIFIHILSYLSDIEDLCRPWSRTCLLFRTIMKEHLNNYCEAHGLRYPLLWDIHYQLWQTHQKAILPLADFVRCTIVRHLIHKIGRHYFKGNTLYPYIPDFMCQFGALPSNPETLRMAMLLGNTHLCLYLLRDITLHQYAQSYLEDMCNGKGFQFLPDVKHQAYLATLPLESIESALNRSFIVCYEKLKNSTTLPSHQRIITAFIHQGKFIFAKALMEYWGFALATSAPEHVISHEVDLYSWITTSSQHTHGKDLLKDFYAFYKAFPGRSNTHSDTHESHWLLFQRHQTAQFSKLPKSSRTIPHKTEDLRSNSHSSIQLLDILHPDPSYLPNLIKEGWLLNVHSFKTALDSFPYCTSTYQLIILKRIQRLLDSDAQCLQENFFRTTLLRITIQADCAPILMKIMELAPKHSVDKCALLVFAAENHSIAICHALQLYLSPDTINKMQSDAILNGQANIIQTLLEANLINRPVDWPMVVTNALEEDNYQNSHIISLCQHLFTHHLMLPTFHLSLAFSRYTERLLKKVHQEDIYIKVDFVALLRLKLYCLEHIYIQPDSILEETIKIAGALENILELIQTHMDDTTHRVLASVKFCYAFRRQVLELEEALFLKNQYPYLIKHLTKPECTLHIESVLSRLTVRWWKYLFSYCTADRMDRYLNIFCQLILNYQIENLTIIQTSLDKIRDTCRWDLIQPLLAWKIKCNRWTWQDYTYLKTCFTEDNYLKGPVQDIEVVEWLKALLVIKPANSIVVRSFSGNATNLLTPPRSYG